MSLPPIAPDTVLQRAPNLGLTLASPKSVQVHLGGTDLTYPTVAVAVLDLLATPHTFRDALEALRGRVAGAQGWIGLSSTLVALVRDGVVVDVTATPVVQSAQGFDRLGIHNAMLNDRPRTDGFLKAIAAAVRPGDVVLDIGTGTGVLAMAAARAGARHVYAIEAGHIAEMAQANVERNGFDDRITILRGWSGSLDLPERADVLVTETLGNDAFGENILETVLDARKRLLVPGARLIPARVRVYGTPVAVPDATLTREGFTDTNVANWQAWYGFDFGALGGTTARAAQALYLLPQKTRAWTTLAPPAVLVDVDLATFRDSVVDVAAETVADVAGTVDAVLLAFDAELGGGVTLTTRPDAAADDNHWLVPIWLLPEPLAVAPGDPLRLDYTYLASGRPNGARLTRA